MAFKHVMRIDDAFSGVQVASNLLLSEATVTEIVAPKKERERAAEAVLL